MIDIENNQQNDEPLMNGGGSFLSDEERSGFSDDDAESFGLGVASSSGEIPASTSDEPAFPQPPKETPTSTPLESTSESSPESVLESANIVGEPADSSADLSSDLSSDLSAQEFIAGNTATESVEALAAAESHEARQDAHEDFGAPTEAKARTVISIPDAEAQRKADAERAANENVRRAEVLKRKKQSRSSALTAVALGVILGALVGLGYVFARQTPLGEAVRTLWATLNGSSGAQTERQTFVASSDSGENALDLTREATPEQNQAEQNQAEQNQAEQNQAEQTSSNSNIQGFSVAAATSAVADDSLTPEKRPTEPASEQGGKEERASAKESSSPPPPATKPTKEQNADNRPQKTAKTPSPAQSTKNPPASVMERSTKRLETGVFAIQVYATPSIADAEDWVERLRRRGMANPVMSSQVVRGQMMYRVRFGLYNSLQEAERDAARFGYRDSWVVRLR